MARTRAILTALAKAIRRDGKSIASFSTNNLYYTGFALLFMQDPGAFVFFLVIIALVVFFPLTGDPMQKVPSERLSIWPLTNRERWVLRAVSVWFNPMTWILVILLVWKRVTLGLWMLLAILFGAGFAAPWRWGRLSAWRWLPSFPTSLNQLIRKNLREMPSTLDFYAALIIAAPAAGVRAVGLLPPEALLPSTLLVMLMLSTCALSLFGLDGEGGFTRYRLLPLPGWQILAAKDAAFLIVSLVLTLPLSPLGGLAAALTALAIGHGSSVRRRGNERRWRLQTSGSLGSSLRQILLMLMAAITTVHWHPLVLGLCVTVYLVSTWRAGWLLEQQLASSMG
jgi:hypothetical protein